jgi:hypothetical protein
MGSRLAVQMIDEHLLIGRDAAWAFYRIPIVSYEFLSEGEKGALLARVSATLAGLKGHECHLLVVPRRYDPETWAGELTSASRGSAAWADYVSLQRAYVESGEFWTREVFLGVRLGSRRSRGLLGWSRRLEDATGTAELAVPAKELARWRERADPTDRLLSGHGLRAVPAEPAELRRLVRRSFFRGLVEPVERPEVRRSFGGTIEMLAEGVVRNGARTLSLEQAGGRSFVASLGFARFPDVMSFPGGEWLFLLDSFDFPVEASVRFEVVPANRAARDANKKLAEANDQARHIYESAADMPLALVEATERAKHLEYSLTKEGSPLVYDHPRLVLWGASEAMLEARVQEVEERYRDHGIDLARPSGDQLSLFLEAIPGDRVRVAAYEQRQALQTLAGSMFVASAELGDGAGPYIGTTTGYTRIPVHFDPLTAPRTNNPAAIPIVGRSGSGKTTTANLLAYQMALRGVWVTAIDPKQEMGRLASLPGMHHAARVLSLGPEHQGLLDPFSLAPTPVDAVPVAHGVCQLLLPGRLAYEHSSRLMRACHTEASESSRPCLDGVVRRLQETPDPLCQELGHTLAVCSTMPVGRLCFRGVSSVAPLRPDAALNVIQLQGLRAPDAATQRDDYTLDNRLAVAVLYLLAQFTLRLLESGDSSQPKAVVFDEAWMLTSTPQGRSLVPALSRMGRSKNGAILLVTQNAGDLLGSEVVNNSSAKLAFRSTDRDEVDNVLKLLGLAATDDNVQLVQSLATGECLMRDVDGRVGTVSIELLDDALLSAFNTTPMSLKEQVGVT